MKGMDFHDGFDFNDEFEGMDFHNSFYGMNFKGWIFTMDLISTMNFKGCFFHDGFFFFFRDG